MFLISNLLQYWQGVTKNNQQKSIKKLLCKQIENTIKNSQIKKSSNIVKIYIKKRIILSEINLQNEIKKTFFNHLFFFQLFFLHWLEITEVVTFKKQNRVCFQGLQKCISSTYVFIEIDRQKKSLNSEN